MWWGVRARLHCGWDSERVVFLGCLWFGSRNALHVSAFWGRESEVAVRLVSVC